jgi:hypothetical protein
MHVSGDLIYLWIMDDIRAACRQRWDCEKIAKGDMLQAQTGGKVREEYVKNAPPSSAKFG